MKFAIQFRPKLADSLKNYSTKDFHHDLIAGLTVGIALKKIHGVLNLAQPTTLDKDNGKIKR